MTLTKKRQTVFPLDWCRREGLERGGPLNVFDLGDDGLLIRPIKAPSKQVVAKFRPGGIPPLSRPRSYSRPCGRCGMDTVVVDTGVFVAGEFWIRSSAVF